MSCAVRQTVKLKNVGVRERKNAGKSDWWSDFGEVSTKPNLAPASAPLHLTLTVSFAGIILEDRRHGRLNVQKSLWSADAKKKKKKKREKKEKYLFLISKLRAQVLYVCTVDESRKIS